MICAWQGCGCPTVGRSRYCGEHRYRAREAWLARTAAKAAEVAERRAEYEVWWAEAEAAGNAAYADPPVSTWVVKGYEGLDPLTTAWVVIRPGTHPFARWLASVGIGHRHARGGWEITYHPDSFVRQIERVQAIQKALRGHGLAVHHGTRIE